MSRFEAMNIQECHEIRQALLGLASCVAGRNDVPFAVSRNLTRDEQLSTDNFGVPITGRTRESGYFLSLIQVRALHAGTSSRRNCRLRRL